jgi:hypothetical protein
MKWYDYFLMMLGIISPMIWTAIKAKHPSFPLTEEIFIETVKWIFTVLAGVKFYKLYHAGIAKGKNLTYDQWVKQ